MAHGPRFGSLDLTLVKRFTLTERTRLDIRGEAFNLFNHVNFKDPNQTTWGDDGFGIINDAFAESCSLRRAFNSSLDVTFDAGETPQSQKG